jgi:hypothetical protein
MQVAWGICGDYISSYRTRAAGQRGLQTGKPRGDERFHGREDTGMKAQLAAVFSNMRRPRAPLELNCGLAGGRLGASIGQLIAALDDRDTRNALDLLDPPEAGAAAGEHRIKCTGGCGE